MVDFSSRKQERKRKRLEQKQRRVKRAAASPLAPRSAAIPSSRAGRKRPRAAFDGPADSVKPQSVGLLALAKVRAPPVSRLAERAILEKSAEDTVIAAEEEELRYLEKKLGLTGPNQAKKEAKLFRDLQKYEGFDDSICDLLKATDHISKMVRGSEASARSNAPRLQAERYPEPAVGSSSEESKGTEPKGKNVENFPDFLESEDDQGLEPLEIEILESSDAEEEKEEFKDSKGMADDGMDASEETDDGTGEDESEASEERERYMKANANGDSEEIRRHSYQPISGEDIYGRLTDPTKAQKDAKYVPPHLRKLDEEELKSEDVQHLRRGLNGLVNRLSESNLESTIKDLTALQRNQPSRTVNRLLTEAMLQLCVSPAQLMKALIPVFVALLAGLHFTAQGNMGPFLLEQLIQNYDTRRSLSLQTIEEEEARARELSNLAMIIAYLYVYKVVTAGFVYDLMRELMVSMKERELELLLVLLRAAGSKLRADDPATLKEVMLQVQEKAGALEGPRVEHMLQVLKDLMAKKRVRAEEKEHIVRLNKVLRRTRNAQKGALGGDTLHVTVEDARCAEQVGASWTGQGASQATTTSKTWQPTVEQSLESEDSLEEDLHGKMQKLASKQRMNTAIRRSIFVAIMAASDYEDAFERLLRLNLTEQQQREMIRVVIDCAGQEPRFNPFYAILAGRLCEYNNKHKFTLQLTFWDIFKLLDSKEAMPTNRAANLAKGLAQLLRKGFLSLAVLKVVDVSALGPCHLVFFREVFVRVLEDCSEKELRAVIQRIGSSNDPLLLSETVTVLLRQCVVKANDTEVQEATRRKAGQVATLIDRLCARHAMGDLADQ